MENEIWKPVVGYEGWYEVSSFGNLRSVDRTGVDVFGVARRYKGRMISSDSLSYGYPVAILMKNGKRKTVRIHRIVAEAFIPNPDNKPFIDHIDTNKLNNSLSNLRWCTDKENSNNEITKEKNRANGLRMWEEGCFDNRNNTHYRKVAQYTRDGEYIKTWDSIVEVEAALGIDASSISSLCLGTNPKRHTAGGYKWKHVGGHYVKEK